MIPKSVFQKSSFCHINFYLPSPLSTALKAILSLGVVYRMLYGASGFYKNHTFVKEYLENSLDISPRSFPTSVFHSLLAVVQDIREIFRIVIGTAGNMFRKDSRYTDFESKDYKREIWKKNSSSLYVFVHAVFSYPATWDSYYDEIAKDDPNADIKLIKVHRRGNCSLEDASAPILKMVENYQEKHPGKPIILVGTSRGGPIVSSIELKLRKEDSPSQIFVGTIAGANGGSFVVTALKGVAVWLGLFDKDFAQEFSFGSQPMQELITAQRKPLPSGCLREYSFYATTEESLVFPFFGSIPALRQKNQKNQVFHGEGHLSLVRRARPLLLDDIKKWMKE